MPKGHPGSKKTPHRGENWTRLPKTDGQTRRPGTLNPDAPSMATSRVRREVDRWVGFVRDAERRGVLPVNIFMDNIEFEHKHVTHWTAEINRMCADIDRMHAELKDSPDLDPDARARMVAVVGDMVGQVAQMLAAVKGARARAQQYACDLAPFLHARLANVTISPGADYEEALAESRAVIPAQVVTLSPDDAAATYLRLVRGETPERPREVEQEVLPPEKPED